MSNEECGDAKDPPQPEDREKILAISAVAHDLQAPLQVLGLSLRGLRMQSQNREAADTISAAEAAYEEVSAIVGDLVDVLQIGSGAEVPREEGVGISALLRSVERRFRRKAADLRVDLRFRASEIRCVSDRRLLRRMLDNLVANALKHSGASRILVSARLRNRRLLALQVLDNGRGIPDRELDRVFNHGYQGSEARKRNVRGQGLGLWIVARLAGAMGGTVKVRSSLGKGSRFSVEIPTYAVPQTQVARRSRLGGSALRGRVIAVLDDDADALRAIQDGLENQAALVFAAQDELNFLATVTTLQSVPDLILVSFNLQGRTAEKVLDTLLSRFGQHLQLAIVTACPGDPRLARFSDRTAAILERPLTGDLSVIVSLATKQVVPDERSEIELEPAPGETV